MKIHDNERYNLLRNLIIDILKTGVIFTKDVFKKAYPQYKNDFIQVVNDILDEKQEFFNINKRNSILQETLEYYIVTPIDLNSTPKLQENFNYKF